LVTSTIDVLRKNKQLKLTESLDNLQIIDTYDSAIEEMQYEDALELVKQLSPVYRAVFNLYVIEGYSHSEIAKELNISIGTSKSNLSRAKGKLRALFGEEYPEY
jgi:RNA polymerase sigma factor (sigma-70 family)